jgi:tRNA A-37 threonylcarbamoyl transferase component Bud32
LAYRRYFAGLRPNVKRFALSPRNSYAKPVIRLTKNGVRWEMQPEVAPLLDEILASPVRVIKESRYGRVAVHRGGGKNFYVKTYRHGASFWRPFKFFFKPSQAHGEWKLAQAFAARGIPIVRHAAAGERWSWRGLQESILITEEFDGQPLADSTAASPEKVLAFIHFMHEHGVMQHDLHCHNLMVGPTGELRLVDLHHSEIKEHFTDEERATNIAYLQMTFPMPVTPAIAQRAAKMRKKHFANRSRRSLGDNRFFAPKQFGELCWQVRLSLATPASEAIMQDPNGFLATRATIFKPGRSCTVGAADGLVLKRYNLRKLLNLVKDLFRLSKAKRSFQKAYHLELTGIPTARSVAAADERHFGFLTRSYFVMEEIRGAVDLGKWHGDTALAAECVAALLAKLHDEGFRHRDLKETNVLFDENGKAILIDLEGLEFVETVSLELAAADLRRLHRGIKKLLQFSQQDWLRFTEHYCKLRGLLPESLQLE